MEQGWTFDTLKTYIDSRFDASYDSCKQKMDCYKNLMDISSKNIDKALDKAENTLDDRFESVNEVRKSLIDHTNTFLTRIEYEAKYETLYTLMMNISERLTKLEVNKETRKEGLGNTSSIIVIIGIITTLIISGLTAVINISQYISHIH